MYNLLIECDSEENYWAENIKYSIEADRILEYTDKKIQEEYINNLDKLRKFPCLFTYEPRSFTDEDKKKKIRGHIGYINSITKSKDYSYEYKREQKTVTIEYGLDRTYPDIFISLNNRSELTNLGITVPPNPLFELYRTHWAVKNKDLFKFLTNYFLERCIVEPIPSSLEMQQIWGENYTNKTLIFLSHKAKYKKQVSEKIKDNLKKENINCFVAHQDIHPTKEWQNEIIKALDTMQIFIGIVTDDFHTESWTDQEIGYAYKRKVPRIFVKLGNLPPKGFISSEQALTADWNNIHKKILEQIKKILQSSKKKLSST